MVTHAATCPAYFKMFLVSSVQRTPLLHHFALTNYLLERNRYLAVRTPLLQDFFRPVTSVFHLLCKSTRRPEGQGLPYSESITWSRDLLLHPSCSLSQIAALAGLWHGCIAVPHHLLPN